MPTTKDSRGDGWRSPEHKETDRTALSVQHWMSSMGTLSCQEVRKCAQGLLPKGERQGCAALRKVSINIGLKYSVPVTHQIPWRRLPRGLRTMLQE